MLSAVTTFVVVQWLHFGVRSYAMVNIGLVGIWFFVALNLYRENRRLTAEPAVAA